MLILCTSLNIVILSMLGVKIQLEKEIATSGIDAIASLRNFALHHYFTMCF